MVIVRLKLLRNDGTRCTDNYENSEDNVKVVKDPGKQRKECKFYSNPYNYTLLRERHMNLDHTQRCANIPKGTSKEDIVDEEARKQWKVKATGKYKKNECKNTLKDPYVT